MRHKIIIHDEVKTAEDGAYLLKEIAKQLEQGYTSGRGGPTWDLEAIDGEKVEVKGEASPEGSQEATEDESGLGRVDNSGIKTQDELDGQYES